MVFGIGLLGAVGAIIAVYACKLFSHIIVNTVSVSRIINMNLILLK